MTAADYPVSFPYGAQDGQYYGPNGSVGLYHRGDDRACPQGTPVVVNGVQIGLTGTTGASSGPHLHLGCFVGSTDANPNGQGFALPGPVLVLAVGYDGLNGNYVKLKDANGTLWVYLHLSVQSVSTGQYLPEVSNKGEEMIIGDGDNWYSRCNKTHLQIRGRELSRDVFNSFVGQDFLHFVEACSDDPEADAALNAQIVGRQAVSNDWVGQISTLQSQLKAAQSALQNKPTVEVIKTVPVYTEDVETKNMITSIYNYFVGQFKSFAKYVKK